MAILVLLVAAAGSSKPRAGSGGCLTPRHRDLHTNQPHSLDLAGPDGVGALAGHCLVPAHGSATPFPPATCGITAACREFHSPNQPVLFQDPGHGCGD